MIWIGHVTTASMLNKRGMVTGSAHVIVTIIFQKLHGTEKMITALLLVTPSILIEIAMKTKIGFGNY